MATLSSNGGVERYWRSTRHRSRRALCHNGTMLKQLEPGGRWRVTALHIEDVAAIRPGAPRRHRRLASALPARPAKRGAVAPMT